MKTELAKGRPNPQTAGRWDGGSRVSTVRCDGCGIEYVDYVKRLEKSRRHFCNAGCYRKSRFGEMNPKWRGGMVTRPCKVCKALFSVFPVFADSERDGIYCSPSCRHEALRKYPNRAITHRENNRRREARERAAANIETHTYQQWMDLLERFAHRCAICGVSEKLTRDHIIPLSKGGSDAIGNIQPLCHSCNARKGNRT